MSHSDSHAGVATPPAARPWPRGQRLGSFELIEAVASGAGGFVYRAFDHALARQVAVKEYLPAALAGRAADGSVIAAPQAVHTFERCRDALVDAWRTLARCDHPALVRMLHQIHAHGTVYGVMPWYAGRPLTEPPSPDAPPLDETTLRALLDDLLGALEAYHRAGRVHGAISAAKVLRLDAGGVLLLGPGAPVRAADRLDAAPLGPWTDLHAMATLFDTLTARHPGRYGAAWRQALASAMAPDLARRPLSAAQFRTWLDTSEGPAPVAAAPVAAAATPPDADTDVDAAAAEVIRRVLDSIPDPVVRPRRPTPTLPPIAPIAPIASVEPTPIEFAPPPAAAERLWSHAMPEPAPHTVIGDDAPPFSPEPRRAHRRRAHRAHWGVRIGLALIFATGAAMVVWQFEQPGAGAALARLLADLPFGPTPSASTRADAPSPAPAAPTSVTPAAEVILPSESAASPAPVARAPAPVAAPPAPVVLPPIAAAPPVAAAPTAPTPPPVATPTPPRRTPAAASSRGLPPGPTSPRAACGERSGFSLYRCMQQQCRLDRWWPHAQCVRLRTTDAVD